MNEIYESFSGYLTEDSKKFLVAFSGGLDSTVLLYALKQALVKEKLNKEILAIHVDHKQNKNSKNWIEHCKKFCETMQVSFACSQIKSNKKALSENGLAAFARMKPQIHSVSYTHLTLPTIYSV